MIKIKKKSKKKIHAIFIDEDNIRRCSMRGHRGFLLEVPSHAGIFLFFYFFYIYLFFALQTYIKCLQY